MGLILKTLKVPQCSTKLAKPGVEYASVSKVRAQVLAPFFFVNVRVMG
jgi:hypothetical protein